MSRAARWLLLVAGSGCAILVGYAWWLAGETLGDPPPAGADRRAPEGADRRALRAPRPSPADPGRMRRPNPLRAGTPPDADARRTRTELGSSTDPDRRLRAERVFAEALAELETMQGATPEAATEVFLRAKSALERIEDETPDDDVEGRARHRENLERLRRTMRDLFPDPIDP